MNSDEVLFFLRQLPVQHVGVYAADRLPLKIPKLSAIVVNTDPHNLSGLHWIALFKDSNGQLEYFDSYGQMPLIHHHIKFIKRNSKHYVYNRKCLQNYHSSVCGLYCLCYLYFRSYKYSMSHFVDIFSSNLDQNDDLVVKLFNCLYYVQ